MTVLEKFEILIKARGLTERQFLMQNHVHFGLVKRMRSGYMPVEKDVRKMCKLYNFDCADFIDPTSTIIDEIKPGEHMIKKAVPDCKDHLLEDYPPEDNARYEEKD